jgi:hypothetical protein
MNVYAMAGRKPQAREVKIDVSPLSVKRPTDTTLKVEKELRRLWKIRGSSSSTSIRAESKCEFSHD